MAKLDITLNGVNLPTNTSGTVYVYEDVGNDGGSTGTSPGGFAYDNTNSTSLSSGTTTYTLSGFDGSSGNAVRVRYELDNTDTVSTAELTEATDVTFGGLTESSLSNEASAITVLPAPSIDTVTVQSKSQIDITWTVNADNGTQRVEYKRSSNTSWTTFSSGLALSTTSESITGLLNGEEYDVRVVAVTNHVESPSTTQTATTDFASISGLSADASVEDQLTTTYDDTANYGNYHLQMRVSGSGDAYGTTDDQTVPETDTSITTTGLADGEEYDIRVRHETEHGSGPWTEISPVTLLPAPTNLSLTVVSSSQIDLSWTENADNEDGVRVIREDEQDNTTPTQSYGPQQTIVDLAANSTSYSDTGLTQNTSYRYRIRAYTEHVTADSAPQTATTNLALENEGYEAVIKRPDGEQTQLYSSDKTFDEVSITLEHTAQSRFNLPLHTDRFSQLRDNWIGPVNQITLYHDGTLLFKGFATTIEGTESTADATITGPDIINRLTQDRQSVTYTNIPAHNAIQDYWDNYTTFTANVVAPSPNQIVNDATAYALDSSTEWTDNTTFGSNTPFYVNSGTLHLAQTCFTQEAESGTTSGSPVIFDANRFSGNSPTSGNGEAIEFSSNSQSVTLSFSLDYDIPAGAFEWSIYFDGDNSGGSIGTVNYYLDGSNLGSFSGATSGGDGVFWRDLIASGSISDPGSVSAGSHTIKIETGSGWSGGLFYMDVVAPHDNRYSYNFDSSVTDGSDGGTYLSGPELYPPNLQTNLATFTNNSSNITSATVDSTWNSTVSPQEIALSVDGGASYQTLTNQADGSVSFSSVGTNLDARLTLGRYGSRSNGTPTTGFNAHSVDLFNVTFDGNDLAVIDNQELRRSDFRNLKTLHNLANYRYAVDYQNETVESFPKGTSNSDSWRAIDRQQTYDTEGYANQVYVEGRQRDDGTYPSATATNNTEVQAKGQTITYDIKDTSLTTEQECQSVARSELGRLVDKDSISGTIDIVPSLVRPGYRYTIDAWGVEMDLERVQFTDAYGQDSGSLQFEIDPSLAQTATDNRADIDSTKDSL